MFARARRVTVFVWLALFLMVLTACSSTKGGGQEGSAGGSDGTSASSGTGSAKASPDALTIVISTEPKSSNVLVADNGPMFQVLYGNVVEGLTMFSPTTGQVEPLLATEWKMVDEKRWRFTLRKEIKFHNGDAFNADAVVANVKYLRDSANKTELDFYVTTILSAEKVDDYTVDILTKVPDPIVPKRMYYLMMVAPSTLTNANWPDKLVGTGPYRFNEWKKGQHMTMSRNDSYWGDKAQIKDVTWTWRKDPSVRLSMLESGEAQIVKDIPVDLLDKAPKVVAIPGNETALIRLNTKRFPTNDIRVRKAIQMAIDIDTVLDALWKGYAVSANGQPVPQTAFGYNPKLKNYPYDPAKAKELVQQAKAVGAKVEIVAPAGRYVKSDEVLEVVATSLREIGLNAEVKLMDYNAWLDTLFITDSSGPIGFFAGTGNELFDADLPMVGYIHSKATKAIPPADPETDKLIEAARQNLDLKAREAQYHEILQRVYDRAEIVNLYRQQFIFGVQKNVDFQARGDDWLLLKSIKIQ